MIECLPRHLTGEEEKRVPPHVWTWLHCAAATGNVTKLEACIDGTWEYPPNGVEKCEDLDFTDNVGSGECELQQED